MSGEGRHADEIKRVAEDGTEYDCQAYGPNSAGHCFVELSFPCGSREECEVVMKRERMILYVNLLAQAALGDETARFVLRTVEAPHQLLNADLDDQAEDQTE